MQIEAHRVNQISQINLSNGWLLCVNSVDLLASLPSLQSSSIRNRLALDTLIFNLMVTDSANSLHKEADR